MAVSLIEALDMLVAAIEGNPYHYEIENQKLFIPDNDACELCEEAADMGWVEDGEVYHGVFGDEDGPPLHPHCGCTLEYRERRYRVYD